MTNYNAYWVYLKEKIKNVIFSKNLIDKALQNNIWAYYALNFLL